MMMSSEGPFAAVPRTPNPTSATGQPVWADSQ